MAALERSKGRDVEYAAGLALGLSGGSSRSEGLADDIAETGVNSGPQNDLICGIQFSLGAYSSQFGVSGPETGDDDPGGRRSHTLVAALSPPRLSTARNASWGISTLPTSFILALPSFCFSSSLRFLVTSPP